MPRQSSYWSNSGMPDYRQMAALWSALAPIPEPFSGLAVSGLPGGTVGRLQPPSIELRESADSLIITATLPGHNPADIDIQATPQSLTFKGQQQIASNNRYGYQVSLEQFQHTIPLPVAVQEQHMQVAFQEDTIVVTLPKAYGWGWRRSPAQTSHHAMPTPEKWTLLDEIKYRGGRLVKGWQQIKQWLGRQLQKLGDRLLEDW